MVGSSPSFIFTHPFLLAAFAIAGWVLWVRFQRLQKNGGILSMAAWLFQFALYAGLLVLCM